jgi:trans-aconitate methyltransferase
MVQHQKEDARLMNNNTVELWDETYRGRTHWRGWPYQAALDALPEDFEPHSVLDVGCGLGDGLLLCKERWPKAALRGIDFSPVAIHTAESRLPGAAIFKKDLNNVGGLGEYWLRADLVLCCETLEHLDTFEHVETFLRALADKAVAVTVPDRGRTNAHHVNRFDEYWFNLRNYKTRLHPHPVHENDHIIVAVWRRDG